ncbi:MAG: S8 family serine peptidase [Verrucomicrobiales bacterium]|nr:S8 family serine peptidase [Verrucomicrobiales bacterium]
MTPTILRVRLGIGWLASFVIGLHAAKSAPPDGLLPKAEIGALRFLATHTNYDGRGVVIAILDTGVDPGAAGLQTTPDGRPKIVDLIDATGDGDVDTSTVVEAKDGKITGLSGRTLHLGREWRNPTGKFHIGLKAGYDFFPHGLVERLKNDHRERWREHQRPLEARIRQELVNWTAQHPSPGEEDQREQREMETRLEQLLDLDQSFEDPGPVFDCVVFQDGTSWRAVVDTDEDGDLGEETVLTNYRAERRYATFGKQALLNFALNIYQDGNVLSIVAEGGNHGTHVAGIAAGYLPDQPDLNGIAPGAQIVGIKNGFAQMGSMETSAAIARGINAVRELRCDIISASFGEYTVRPNHGRLIDLMSELVRDAGVIFVAAAGNNGPALSTVIAPGGTSSALIGVAAYLSPAMGERFASMSGAIPETLFQFSSRGPTVDGALGVSVCAPGGAFSSGPPWTLGRHLKMAGTSMATPSVSGAVALLLSGLKAEKRNYSPMSVRRALENSARAIPGIDRLTQGHGLIQVDAAFALCQKLAEAGVTQPGIEVTISPSQSTPASRGIYLRDPEQTRHRQEFFSMARAVFPKKTDNSIKLAFENRYKLTSTAPWVASGNFLFLSYQPEPYGGLGFEFAVDPTSLVPGVHTAEILGFEEGREDLGPAFRVPITVMRPEAIGLQGHEPWHADVVLHSTFVSARRFLAVPPAATWATLTVRSRTHGQGSSFGVVTSQLLADRLPSDGQREHFFQLDPTGTERVEFPVTAGRTLELTVGQRYDTSTNECRVGIELAFHGVTPESKEVFMDGGSRVARVEVTAGSEPAKLQPAATLQIHRRTVHPSGVDLHPLNSERDRLPEGRQGYELILTYSFEVNEAGSVTPWFPALSGRLYDGDLEGQIWMLFDGNRQRLTVDDAWKPGPVQLGKGPHTLRFQLRHERVDRLEKMKTLPVVLDQKLSGDIVLSIHPEPGAAVTGGDAYHGETLAPGATTAFYLAAPATNAVPDRVKPGELLLGEIRYESDPSPVRYPLSYLVPPAAVSPTEKSAPADPDERPMSERLSDERRDLAMAQLDKLTGGTNEPLFEQSYQELQRHYPDHPPLLMAKLRHLAAEDRTTNNLRRVVDFADEIIRRTDTNALRAHFGSRVQDETLAARKAHQEMEKQRDRLVEALHRKALALARLGRLQNSASTNLATGTVAVVSEASLPANGEFDAALRELRRWVDTAADEYVEVQLHDLEVHGRLGEALKRQRTRIEAEPTDRDRREQAIRILERLGWDRWADHERQWLLRRYPKEFPFF